MTDLQQLVVIVGAVFHELIAGAWPSVVNASINVAQAQGCRCQRCLCDPIQPLKASYAMVVVVVVGVVVLMAPTTTNRLMLNAGKLVVFNQ